MNKFTKDERKGFKMKRNKIKMFVLHKTITYVSYECYS